MTQREKPAPSLAELEATLGVQHHPDNRCSGGQFESFREGWAKELLNGSRVVHYFRRCTDISKARSLCGHIAPVRWLYGPGNIERCKLCQRMADRRNSAHRV